MLTSNSAVYRAVVLLSLLYCCEIWCLCRRQLRKLEQFHMRCLLNIARIRWQDKMPNTDVMDSIEATLMKHQFPSVGVGHVTRMPNTLLPKCIFYDQLPGGGRSQRGQRLPYKDVLKRNLKACDIPAKNLVSLAQDRSLWCTTSRETFAAFETSRTDHLRPARDYRKQELPNSVSTVCRTELVVQQWLFAHERSHRKTD